MRTLALIAALLIAAPCDAGDYMALILAAAQKTSPNPQPAPAPSGICDNCNGTGKLGDGTISVTCPVCDGTGKLTSRSAPASRAPAAPADSSPAIAKAIKSAPPAAGFYPTDSSHWSYPGSGRAALINHLMTHSKHRKFSRSYLETLSLAELSTLHDHDHEGNVRWQYVNGTQAKARGRWVTQRICNGRTCRTVRVWQPY